MGKFLLWIFLLYQTKRFEKTLAGICVVCYNVNTCLNAGKAFLRKANDTGGLKSWEQFVWR